MEELYGSIDAANARSELLDALGARVEEVAAAVERVGKSMTADVARIVSDSDAQVDGRLEALGGAPPAERGGNVGAG